MPQNTREALDLHRIRTPVQFVQNNKTMFTEITRQAYLPSHTVLTDGTGDLKMCVLSARRRRRRRRERERDRDRDSDRETETETERERQRETHRDLVQYQNNSVF